MMSRDNLSHINWDIASAYDKLIQEDATVESGTLKD